MATPEPLVRVEGLAVHFSRRADRRGRGSDDVRAVDEVSFCIYPQETFGLVGESGSGKTTLARAILHLINVTAGEVYFQGRPTSHSSERARQRLRRHMQIVFQDPYAALDPRQRVLDAMLEPLLTHGMARTHAEAARRATELAALVGLGPDVLTLRPRHLSGGQRQRAVIARALAVGAQFLVLDEPTSFLDVSVQARVLQLLKDLQRQLRLTYLFISHNLDVVAYMSDRIGVMYQGRLVEVAPAGALLLQPLHPYTQALASAVLPPDPEEARRKQFPRLAARGRAGGCRYYPVCPQGQPRCILADPPLLEVRAQHAAACYLVDGFEEVMKHGRSGGGTVGTDSPDARLCAADARGPGQG